MPIFRKRIPRNLLLFLGNVSNQDISEHFVNAFYNLCPRMAWSPSITKIQGRTRTGSKGYCVRKMTPTTKPTYQDDVETRQGVGS